MNPYRERKKVLTLEEILRQRREAGLPERTEAEKTEVSRTIGDDVRK